MHTIAEPVHPTTPPMGPQFAPPTIPLPPAPRRGRGLLVGALVVTVIVLGSIIAVLASHGADASPTNTRTTESATVVTTQLDQINAGATTSRDARVTVWALEYADEITAFVAIAATPSPTNPTVGEMSAYCSARSGEVIDLIEGPVSTDNAPQEWGKMLWDLRQGYMDCLNGDYESASNYLHIAAGDIDAFTALLKSVTP